MEQRIIGKVCPGQPIRRIGCNGDDVSIKRMCDFIETQIRTLGNRNYPIFVIFDREKRTESADEIQSQVLIDLQDRGLGDQDIRIYVADRETEDWYLHDKESICDHYGLPMPEGILRGKSGLEKILSTIGGYHETTIGVELFFIVSKTKIGKCCSIFSELINTAAEINCSEFADENLI